MLSIDTNILFPAMVRTDAHHASAFTFLNELEDRDDVAISEFALLELYVLLRNPAVLIKPLGPLEATGVCTALRQHPHWQILGFPGISRDFHDAFWPKLAEPGFARRRAYDWRMALTLVRQGVEEFATVNVKDFGGFGFKKVWNPIKAEKSKGE